MILLDRSILIKFNYASFLAALGFADLAAVTMMTTKELYAEELKVAGSHKETHYQRTLEKLKNDLASKKVDIKDFDVLVECNCCPCEL